MARIDQPQDLLDRLDSGRRDFLKKVLLTAYAAPFVASFGMRGLGMGEAMAQSNTCSNISVPNSSADLIISKTGFPATVAHGGQITYNLLVQNCGPSIAVNVSVSDPLPAGTTFQSANQTSGPAFTLSAPAVGATGTFTATIASLAVGGMASFQLVVNVQ